MRGNGMMERRQGGKNSRDEAASAGLAGWLLNRLKLTRRPQPRLALIERIALAPRQSLALVEAEGRRFLVATSPEGAPAFYPLDIEMSAARAAHPGNPDRSARPLSHLAAQTIPDRSARISW